MKDKNPFNKECNSFAQKFDEALDAQDWDATQRTIRDAESYISKHSGPNTHRFIIRSVQRIRI